MEKTLENIEKLTIGILDRMDTDALMDYVFENLFDYYHEDATQEEFDDDWAMTFGDSNEK